MTINVSGYGDFGSVEETLPGGFAYVSSSGLAGGSVAVSGQEVTFTLLDEKEFHLHGHRLEHGGPPFLQRQGHQ